MPQLYLARCVSANWKRHKKSQSSKRPWVDEASCLIIFVWTGRPKAKELETWIWLHQLECQAGWDR
jgi:hypothetical protein